MQSAHEHLKPGSSQQDRLRQSLLSIDDLDRTAIERLLSLCRDFSADEERFRGALAGRSVGLMFNKPSTRTQVSFWRAARDLGADVMPLNENQIQLSTGETHGDTGRILELFLDAVVMRTNGPLAEMRALSVGPAVINAMSSCEHPTQALADYTAIHRRFARVEGVRIAYFGEGNNTVTAMAKLFSHVPGCQLDLYMPRDYAVDPAVAAQTATRFEASGGRLRCLHDLSGPLSKADVIYCTRWRTMGVGHADPDWLSHFLPFKMTPELFAKVAADGGVFMHDLPSVREEDAASEVLDGPRSIAWDQAYCKKIGAAAALLFALG